MRWIGSLLLGGILAGINLYLLAKLVQRITGLPTRKGRLILLVAEIIVAHVPADA